MGETDETKLDEDFQESEEQLDAVEEDRDEKSSLADRDASKELEDELQRLKKQLSIAEEERHRAEAELKKAKTEAGEEKSRLSEALSAEKAELELVKKSLSSTNQQLKIKEEEIELLKTLARKIGEKDAELEKLNETLTEARKLEPRVRELEQELERLKESEAKAVESLAGTKKELEELKVTLEESRVSTSSLRDKYEELLRGGGEKDEKPREESDSEVGDMLESLTDELQLTKENLFRAQEGERAALSKAQSLLSEIGKLRNELKLATNAEINSAKAMDDLAIALSELAAESNKAKMQLGVVEAELESSRREVEELKLKGKSAEEMYVSLLEESRREAEEYKKKAERSTLDAEETLLTWNDKELGFIKCIRRAEEEKSLVVEENIRLLDLVKRAENTVKSSKEENAKLRDILKQALNEANVAKEAANIAKAENAHLKDCLVDKEEAIEFMTMEIENLKANEAELMSKVKKSVSSPPTPTAEREAGGLDGNLTDKETGSKNDKELRIHKESPKILGKAFSFNIKELRIHTKHNNKDLDSGDEKNKDHNGEEREAEDEDSEDYDPLKGSIFDVMDSPGSARHRRKGSGCSGDGSALTAEELNQLEDSHLHDLENGRMTTRRRRLLRKFGDLIIRRRPSMAEQPKQP